LDAHSAEVASNLTSQTRQKDTARFSFLLPTRGRPDGVLQFLTSLVETTEELDQVEVILGVDDDDPVSQQIVDDRVRLKIVLFRHGLTMGAMNRACFEASCGRYVFLMNDDVVCCTKGWDRRVRETFEAFGDDIALIHVNDGIFGDKLCTFPLLSRQACLEVGLCPQEYRRYKIDDHIMETYTLLERLGFPRIIYLEDVLFRHDNFRMAKDSSATAQFFAPGGRVYAPDPVIAAQDGASYEAGIETRKDDALRLAALIEPDRNLEHLSLLLAEVHDPYCYRRRRVVQPPVQRRSRHGSKVAVGLVTQDIRSAQARRCLDSLRHALGAIDLVFFDVGRTPQATWPLEMNRALGVCDADFLLLLEDDVTIGTELLDGLLECMDDFTALVAPVYRDFSGEIVSSGVYLLSQDLCVHEDLTDRPDAPRVRQAVRSGALLIDMKKCRSLRFSSRYQMACFDVDYCLQVWEAGYRVVTTPDVDVRRSGRAAVIMDSVKASLVIEAEEADLAVTWIDSRRLQALAQRAWQGLEEMQPALDSFGSVARLLANSGRQDAVSFIRNWEQAIAQIRAFPLMRRYAALGLRLMLAGQGRASGDALHASCLRMLEELDDKDRPIGFWHRAVRKFIVEFTHNIRNRPALTRLAMALTRLWRDLMWRHEKSPIWVRHVAAPLVQKVQQAYDYASNVTRPESLGCYAGYRLVGFDGLVCAVPISSSNPEASRQLLSRADVVLATTVGAARRKIERINTACGIRGNS
jgi:hypothetical protein